AKVDDVLVQLGFVGLSPIPQAGYYGPAQQFLNLFGCTVCAFGTGGFVEETAADPKRIRAVFVGIDDFYHSPPFGLLSGDFYDRDVSSSGIGHFLVRVPEPHFAVLLILAGCLYLRMSRLRRRVICNPCNMLDIVGANQKIFGRPAYCSRYPP